MQVVTPLPLGFPGSSLLWECREGPSVPSATLAPWRAVLSCMGQVGLAVPAQAVPVTSTASLISPSKSSSCTKGTFRDTFVREKRGKRERSSSPSVSN